MLTNRLDSFGATLLPVLYLAATITATGWYFSNGDTGYVGVIFAAQLMAFATELHSFLVQRRTRIAYRLHQVKKPNDFTMQLSTLIAIVAFQCFIGISYSIASWHAPLAAQVVRGCVIPIFFLLGGMLAHIDMDAQEMLQRYNQRMLLQTLQTVAQQWKKRLDALRKNNTNLASVAVAMLEYEGDTQAAERIRTLDTAFAHLENSDTVSASVVSETTAPRGDWGDFIELSEPALKRQIRHLLDEDATLTPRELQDACGCAYSIANRYYHEIMEEKGLDIVPRKRKSA